MGNLETDIKEWWEKKGKTTPPTYRDVLNVAIEAEQRISELEAQLAESNDTILKMQGEVYQHDKDLAESRRETEKAQKLYVECKAKLEDAEQRINMLIGGSMELKDYQYFQKEFTSLHKKLDDNSRLKAKLTKAERVIKDLMLLHHDDYAFLDRGIGTATKRGEVLLSAQEYFTP